MLHKTFTFLIAGLMLFLQGCASAPPAPKLTPAEVEAQRIATFNVYEDNEVGFMVASGTSVVWMWPAKPGYILALEAGGRLYNVKDVKIIESTGDTYGKTVKVVFTTSTEGKRFPLDDLKWRLCKHDKTCQSWTDVSTEVRRTRTYASFHSESLQGILSSVSETELQSAGTNGRRVLYNLPPGQTENSAPGFYSTVGKDTIVVLQTPALQTLAERRGVMMQRWQASRDKDNQRAIEVAARDAAQLKAATPGTQMSCRFEGTMPVFQRLDSGIEAGAQERLTCQGLTNEQQLSKLKQQGWVVLQRGVSPDLYPNGNMQFYRYEYVLQRQ